MKIEIKIKNEPTIVTEEALRTEVKDSFYIVYFDKGRYIYPARDIIEIKETFEDQKIKVLGSADIET